LSKGKVVIGLTGMPGSGKSTVNQIFSEQGYPTIVMGDFVRREAKKLGLKATRKNLAMLMIHMREKGGPATLAKCTIPEVKKLNSPIVLIDGIRNIVEVEEFRNHFSDFRLIAIHSPSKLRFKRLLKRRRKDDPTSWESFTKRDCEESKVGLSGVIEIADKVIENLGSLKDFEIKVRRLLENL
jgi:dephospho-CoA kinase